MTAVRGDAAGCAAVGGALQRAARGVSEEAYRLRRAAVVEGWSGSAADAFADTVARQQAAAAGLVSALGQAGRALATFAGELEAAQVLAARAAWADDAATGERLAAAAGRAADEARTRLAAALRRLDAEAAAAGAGGWSLGTPGLPDWADLANNLVLAPRAFAERAALEAAEAGRAAKLLKAGTKAGSAAERATARVQWREALRAYRELRDVSQAYDDLARVVPPPRWLMALDEPLAHTVPVLNKVPIAAVLLVGVSSAMDTADGMSPGLAVTKNVAATGAGMLAYGVAASALVTAGVVGAPVVLGAVAVGFVVSWGVGEAVEHYGDDIAEAAGDVAAAADDALDAVGDAAGRAWDAVFG